MAKRLIPFLNRMMVEKVVPPSNTTAGIHTTAGILLPEKTAKVGSVAVDNSYKRISHELLPRRPARDLNNDEVNTSDTEIVELEKSNIPLMDPTDSEVSQYISFGEKDLASDESLWSLYERWMDHNEVSRDLCEMKRRFNAFKETAKFVHEFNKKEAEKEVPNCELGLNIFADTPHEEYVAKYCLKEPLTG